jgi:exopolysaccharide biosynthesis polyprenyl glycosylphosphotransferase
VTTFGTVAGTDARLFDNEGVPGLGRRMRRHPLRLTLLADLVGAVLAFSVVDLVGAEPSPYAGAVVTTLWLVLMFSARAYEPMPSGFSEMRWRRVLRAGVGLGLACLLLSAARSDLATPAQLVLLTGAVTGAALCHRVVTKGLRVTLRAPLRPTPVLVAGDPDDVRRVLVELRRGRTQLWDVVAVCLTREPEDDDFGGAVRIGVDDLLESTADTGAEAAIVVPGRQLDPSALRRLSWRLERTGIQLFLGTGMLDVGRSRVTVVRGGDLGMVHVRPVPFSGPARIVKSTTERLAAGLALVLLAPLFLVVALAVRLDSPGGVIFRQTRVGVRGREFTMLKFRSMTEGADSAVEELAQHNESDGVLFKIRNDPRITRVGRLLRRYSLDELPQLLNVLRGDMALVGPRPALPEEVAQYDADARRRLAVRPGLTGLWQVSGRSDLTWEDTVRLDLHYVDNWSFLLDLGIVLRTIGVVVGHRGAY